MSIELWPSQCGAPANPSNPWNLPDWRDVKNYPEQGARPHIWRWQFLRRSPTYRSVWEQFWPNTDAWFTAVDGALPQHDVEAKKYNLAHLINPSANHIPDEIQVFLEQLAGQVMPASYVEEVVEDFVREARAQDLYLATFNVNAPMESQWQAVLSGLDYWKTQVMTRKAPEGPRKRERADAFPLYLRLLDAPEKKATWTSIEAVFRKEKASRSSDSLRASFRTAKSYRDKIGAGEE